MALTTLDPTPALESTARAAHDLGHHVVLAVDAMSDRDADSHQHSVQRIFPGLGETTTTDEILDQIPDHR